MINDQQFQLSCNIINGMHNAADQPDKETNDELTYSNRMVERLLWYHAEAGTKLILAAMCHHLKRWEIPRADFAMDKQGYFMWRRQVAKHQLNLAETALLAGGIQNDTISTITDYLKKENLKRIPESQIIEDVACMVFVEHYLEDFARPHQAEKVVDILYKTMLKMSPKAIGMVRQLKLSAQVNDYVARASELLRTQSI